MFQLPSQILKCDCLSYYSFCVIIQRCPHMVILHSITLARTQHLCKTPEFRVLDRKVATLSHFSATTSVKNFVMNVVNSKAGILLNLRELRISVIIANLAHGPCRPSIEKMANSCDRVCLNINLLYVWRFCNGILSSNMETRNDNRL